MTMDVGSTPGRQHARRPVRLAPARARLTAGAALALALLLAGCGAGGPTIAPPGGSGTLQATSPGELTWARQVFDLTNAARVEHGLAPLQLDETASFAAYDHAWDMDLRDFFAHENPDGEGPQERMARHGVLYQACGENLARGQASPEEVVQAWLASPPHRANLLYPHWTHVGIGVHTGGERGPWWAQEFFR